MARRVHSRIPREGNCIDDSDTIIKTQRDLLQILGNIKQGYDREGEESLFDYKKPIFGADVMRLKEESYEQLKRELNSLEDFLRLSRRNIAQNNPLLLNKIREVKDWMEILRKGLPASRAQNEISQFIANILKDIITNIPQDSVNKIRRDVVNDIKWVDDQAPTTINVSDLEKENRSLLLEVTKLQIQLASALQKIDELKAEKEGLEKLNESLLDFNIAAVFGGPCRLLEFNRAEILRNGRPDFDKLKREAFAKIHEDRKNSEISPLCPEKIREILKRLNHFRSTLVELALEEIKFQIENNGNVQDSWLFRKDAINSRLEQEGLKILQ
jgi:hypothetical protein